MIDSIEIDSEEEYLDEELVDSEARRVFNRTIAKEVIVEDSSKTDRGHEDYQSHQSDSLILPLTFFDIDCNIELLKRCCPLVIKLVDCEKHPWYYKNTKVTKQNEVDYVNSHNLIEVDCIEIFPADENDDYNINNVMDVNKQLDIYKTDKKNSISKKQFENTVHVGNRTFNNNNDLDYKKNRGLVGLTISETRIILDDKPDKIQLNQTNHSPYEMATYARPIDKSYRKLPTINKSLIKLEHVKDTKTNEKTRKISIDEQNINKANNYTHAFYKNKNASPKSKPISSKSGNQIIDTLENNVIVIDDEGPSTVEYNNGSSSPLLPLPQKLNMNNRNKINMLSNTPFPSTINQNLKQKHCCKKHFFSANRIIPHYHNKLSQGFKKTKSSNVPQNIPNILKDKYDGRRLDTQYNNSGVDYGYTNGNVIKNYNQNKQNRLINGLLNNNYANCYIPLGKNGHVSHYDLNQDVEAYKNDTDKKHTQSGTTNIFDSVSQSNTIKESKSNDIIVSRVPIIIDKRTKMFTPVSNGVNFECSNFIEQNQPLCPNHNPSNIYNQENNLVPILNLENAANFYEHQSLASSLTSPLIQTSARLCRPQKNILNVKRKTNNNGKMGHVENRNITVSMAEKDVSMNVGQAVEPALMTKSSYVNQRLSKKKQSIYGNQHPYLTQFLERTPLKMKASLIKSNDTHKQINQNNIDFKINHGNNNMDKKMLYTLLNNKDTVQPGTDYVNNAVGKNNNVTFDGSKAANDNPRNQLVSNESVKQSALKVSQSNIKTLENSANSVKPMGKGYSPAILPILSYQKMLEIVSKIKRYDFEEEKDKPHTLSTSL